MNKNSMHDLITHMPQEIILAYEKKISLGKIDSSIQNIVISGMGGSAISGLLAKAAFEHILPIEVVRNYSVPIITSQTLFIPISYSGETAETLSCLEQAKTKTKNIIGISTGGTLEKTLLKNNFSFVKIADGFPPRAAIAHLFFPLLKILENLQIIPSQKDIVQKLVGLLIGKAGAVCDKTPFEKNLAKQFAKNIYGKIPVIYSSKPLFESIAYRFKCQINENAKYPAFCGTFPEMNHNEIEGYENKKFDFLPIFLMEFEEDPKYLKRISAFKELIEDSLDIFCEGHSFIEKAFSLIYFGDIVSYYLAELGGVDPFAIEYITFLKSKIK